MLGSVAVVDEGSFTAAGRRENVSQSGVSAQIKQLERVLAALAEALGARAPG